MPTKAIVKYNGIPAGELSRDSSGYIFRYLESYLHNSRCPAISLSLPKREEPFTSRILFPFFYGMLSEGENKEIFCKVLKIDKNDHFSLLVNTAVSDTIGAVTVQRMQ
ncbi:MAG: HipA N-terminal domain-containing protein [Ignavibacteriaceae bacterium]|nr:HipA N-terminal domain-containing protein [Ignavibacteriaceae bacterium]